MEEIQNSTSNNQTMNEKPVIAVVGFPRSGTSLMMRMLHQGGLDVVAGNYASYEDDRANFCNEEFEFLRDCGGKAVKLLEAQRMRLPEISYNFIWMRRQAREQGKSQAKFLKQVMALPVEPEAGERLAQGILRDTLPAQARLMRMTRSNLCEVWFERLLSYPREEALKVQNFLNAVLDVDAMVAQVKKRPTGCLEGFMELEWAGR